MALKTEAEVVLKPAEGIRNIFINDWKKKYYSDNKKKIACIPFIRNLVEYTKGEDDPHFTRLTSLLHWKVDTPQIPVSEVDGIYNSLFNLNGASQSPGTFVVDLIESEAKDCLNAPEGLNFENKVILAIATRLSAEKFMISKINDATFLATITSNQTNALFQKYLSLFPNDAESINVIKRVNLMTPENIHLNSFMYEPILDMSDKHLRDLYSRTQALT